MFRVLSDFADLQDSNHVYRIGDVYPHDGYTPTEERVEELSTDKNRLHIPLIKIVEEPKAEEQTKQEKPKRKRAQK